MSNLVVVTNYDGQTANGMPHGKGSFYDSSKGTFSGTFNHNVFIEGEIIPFVDLGYLRKDEVYVGKVRNMIPHGKGVATYRDENGIRYVFKGEFVDGYPMGVGLFSKGGITYYGYIKNKTENQRHLFVGFPYGTTEEKEAQDWQESDYDTMTVKNGYCSFSNGSYYLGPFKNGQYHGEGTVVLCGGKINSGTFENGNFIKGNQYDRKNVIKAEGFFQNFVLVTGTKFSYKKIGDLLKMTKTYYANGKKIFVDEPKLGVIPIDHSNKGTELLN